TLDPEHNTSIALMLHGSIQDSRNLFGIRSYDVKQLNGYAQLMFETDFTEKHNLSVGASLNHDGYDETASFMDLGKTRETTFGVYAQYTYKLGETLTVMPGLRWDRSDIFGSFVTPRIHLKYSPSSHVSFRASAGKGYRTSHPLAENVNLLASGRELLIDPVPGQEEAWNIGLSVAMNFPVHGRMLEINAEYYYTDFINQEVVNVDGSAGDHTFSIGNLDGQSFSHTVQVDATYPFSSRFSATAAFRLNDVRCTYDGILQRKFLTSRYKGLMTLSYKTPLELWHFDVTGQLNGGGVLYDRSSYPAFFQLQAQITREFPHFSIYLGGENLTNYKMANPVLNPTDPWSPNFDATQVWGPVTGAMAYIGVRFKIEKI
ncbi:MAG: TonB-dependent receptor plug domain-containing protein, partial [Candidatus Cryptobacteroides sp.]